MEDVLAKQQSELAALIAQNLDIDGIHATAIAHLSLIRISQPTAALHVMHQPALCIIAQGKKQVMLADAPYHYGSDQCLLVTIELPILGQVVEATPTAPYLCLRLDLDPKELGILMMESGLEVPKNQQLQQGLSLSPVNPPLLDAAIRLVRLLATPKDISILAPLTVREMLYRLLSTEHSRHLCQIALSDYRLYAISQAIQWLKTNYAKPVRIEAIAQEIGMSPSAFHHQFKTVTSMSPLQYQKHLRLQEARRLMLGQGIDAATASYQVGYASPSQFSREYKRLFGSPPYRDILQLKNSLKS